LAAQLGDFQNRKHVAEQVLDDREPGEERHGDARPAPGHGDSQAPDAGRFDATPM